METPVARRTVLATALLLLALGSVYQLKGNRDLIWGTAPGDAIDLRNRDLEQALFAVGADPYDHMTASQPPWAYQFGALLTWPEWPAVRAYFAVLNLVALLFLMWWAFHLPRDATPEVRWLLAASVLAFGGSCTATEVGQISIIVTALLAGALVCERTGHPYWCGLLVALSLIKPTISAPFAIALLVAARYRAAAAAAVYGAWATAITWVVTSTSPFELLREMATTASGFIHDGTLGLVDVASALGASPQMVLWLPLLIALPGLVLMAMARSSLPLVFAIAAVWARLWTYHKSYDDVMLVLVMIPLGVLAFGQVRSRLAIAAFLAMGALAWIPGRVLAVPEIQVLQLFVWPLALAVLIALHRGATAPVPSPSRAHLESLHA